MSKEITAYIAEALTQIEQVLKGQTNAQTLTAAHLSNVNI